MVDRLLPVESSGSRESERPELSSLDQVYVIASVITLFAYVWLVWIGHRDAERESMPIGEARDTLSKWLARLDEIWLLLIVLFCSLAVELAWFRIPAGA